MDPKIGGKIKKLRKRNKMTQADLGNLLHVSDKTISKWENSGSIPDIGMVKRISEVFNVHIDSLIDNSLVPKEKKSLKRFLKKILIFIFNNIYKIIFIIVFVLLLIFFVNNYKFVKIYSFKNDKSVITYDKGYFIETKDKNILIINNIQVLNIDYEEVSSKIKLYTYTNGDKVYFYERDDTDTIVIEELEGYDEIFNKMVIKGIKKGIYIIIEKIDTNGKIHIYETKFDTSKSVENSKLLYIRNFDEKKITSKANVNLLDEVMLLKNNFKKDNATGYFMKKIKKGNISVDLKLSKITMYEESNKINSTLIYYYDREILKNVVTNKKKNLINSYEYNIKKDVVTCFTGTCDNYQENVNKVLKLIKNLTKS